MPLFTGMRFIFSFVPQNCWNGCTKLSGILAINTGNIVYVVKGVVVNYWMDSDKPYCISAIEIKFEIYKI